MSASRDYRAHMDRACRLWSQQAAERLQVAPILQIVGLHRARIAGVAGKPPAAGSTFQRSKRVSALAGGCFIPGRARPDFVAAFSEEELSLASRPTTA